MGDVLCEHLQFVVIKALQHHGDAEEVGLTQISK